ncbi:metallopeptidase family protein [Elusimicrobiota bacterium]
MSKEKITFEEFETIIENSVNALPKKFKDILDKNHIKLIPRDDLPESIRSKYPGKVVFGIFIGVPYGRFFHVATEPTRIELYKKSFEKVFDDPDEIREQIIKTVIHEIGHYFGFSEEAIRKLGY